MNLLVFEQKFDRVAPTLFSQCLGVESKLFGIVHDGILLALESQLIDVSWTQILRKQTPSPANFSVRSVESNVDIAYTTQTQTLHLSTSFLTASIALNCPQAFLTYASRLYRQEKCRVRNSALKTFAPYHEGVQLWPVFAVKHYDSFFQACRSLDTLFDVLGILYHLLHRTSHAHMLHIAYEQHLRNRVAVTPQLMVDFMLNWPLHACLGPRATKKILYPKIPFQMFSQTMLENMMRHNGRQDNASSIIVHLIIHTMLCSDAALAQSRPNTLAACVDMMHHRVSAYMRTVHSHNTAQYMRRSSKVLRALTSGYAFLVPHKHILSTTTLSSNPQNVSVCFWVPLQGCAEQKRVFAAVVRESDHKTLWPDDTTPALFIKRGACLDLNPVLTATLSLQPRFHNVVPRLRFSAQTPPSDGVFLPHEQYAQALSMMNAESERHATHMSDVTSPLALARWRCPKVLRYPSYKLWGVPYYKRCFVTIRDLRALAAVFATLQDAQKHVFYLLFWDLPVLVVSWVHKPTICRVVNLLLQTLIQSIPPDKVEHHMTIAKHVMLWSKVLPLLRVLDTGVRAFLRVVLSRGVYLQAVLDASHDAEELAAVVQLLADMQVLVESVQGLPNHDLARVFDHPCVPVPLKRVCYHSALESAAMGLVSSQATVPSHALEDVKLRYADVPCPSASSAQLRTKLNFVLPSQFGRTIVVSRNTRDIANPGILRTHLSESKDHRRASAPQFNMCVHGEEARGEAVFAEALQLLWSRAVDTGLFVPDTGPHDFTLSTDKDARFSDEVFALGFVSSLCVARGLYLPIALSPDLWAYVCYDHSFAVPYQLLFRAFERLKQNAASLSRDERKAVFDVTEQDETVYGDDPYTNDDFLATLTIPNKTLLREFKAGWDVFASSTLNIEQVHPQVVADMFNLPAAATFTDISYAKFAALVVERQCVAEKTKKQPCDFFLTYAASLDAKDLRRVVEFVTGKPRLPLTAYGEPPLTILWVDSPATMPLAQNCTSTLLLPHHAQQNVREFMNPVFHYDTVFGFL